jgi:hypothetical protein
MFESKNKQKNKWRIKQDQSRGGIVIAVTISPGCRAGSKGGLISRQVELANTEIIELSCFCAGMISGNASSDVSNLARR